MEREEISFFSAGYRLKGFWYPAQGGAERSPAVVICHGFSGMIELQVVGIPEALSEAGYGALTFYCRGIGESEGPRGRVIPWEQADDIRNAMTYVQTRDDVDPGRIGLFGNAWGCSVAVAAASLDHRAKALVGTVGIGDCERWLKSERPRWEWKKFLQRLEDDRVRRVLTGESEVVHPNEIHIPDHAASEARDRQWNEFIAKSGYKGYPLETASALLDFKPEQVVGHVSPGAVMFIHMGEDMTVPVEESVMLYEKAREPKELVIFEGKQHYDTFKFTNPEVFGQIMDRAIGWYGQHLGGSALMMTGYELWIDGKARAARSGATFHRASPFDGSAAGSYANGAADDARDAIDSARAAFDDGSWPRMPARDRCEVLMRAAAILREHEQDVLESMARESGKPLRVGRGEFGIAVRTIEYYAGAALDLEGSAISNRRPDAIGLVLKEPVGVAGFITPWNFPILNPVVKIAPALAVGCTIVTKPSHLCPGPTLLLARYLGEAGLPGGALNVVTSDLERGAVVGQEIAASPAVDKIAFTGSTATGHAVMRTATETTKRVSLELGGKSANIVFADAPFADAARTSVTAFCNNSGQQCSARTRLLVQRGIHEQFVAALVKEAAGQVLGDPLAESTTMGPLVNAEQHAKVMNYIDIGKQAGTLVAGGGVPGAFPDSLFVTPTIFDGVDNSSRIAQEEVFGPVLCVIPFDSEADAVRIANETRYGLAGGVWSASLDTALRVVKSVRTGKMFVNCYNNSGLEDLPHGGYKDSGLGREQGRYGLDEFQEIKTVQIKLGGTGG